MDVNLAFGVSCVLAFMLGFLVAWCLFVIRRQSYDEPVTRIYSNPDEMAQAMKEAAPNEELERIRRRKARTMWDAPETEDSDKAG